jgi:glycosyltransferase involved in cell wall biosynthesis
MVKPHFYSDGISHKKIVILGINPPPLGGISVHVQRVTHKFRAQNNAVFVFDAEKRTRGLWGFCVHQMRLISFLLKHKPDLVYHHTVTCFFRGRLLELSFVLALKKLLGFNLIMVDHVSRFWGRQSWLYKKIANLFLRGLDQQVLVGSSTYTSYRKNKIFLGKCWSVEAAFLPPDLDSEHEIVAAYSSELHAFLQTHSPVILANASKLVLFQESVGSNMSVQKELYGFDLCLASMQELRHHYPTLGLAFVLAGAGDEKLFAHLKKAIEKNESVYFMYQCPVELWPLIKRVDLFVRPTLSDGASVSVQEALWVGTPTLASDVCERPAGTVLFKTGDQEDFVKKVMQVLSKNEAINMQCHYSNTQQTL